MSILTPEERAALNNEKASVSKAWMLMEDMNEHMVLVGCYAALSWALDAVKRGDPDQIERLLDVTDCTLDVYGAEGFLEMAKKRAEESWRPTILGKCAGS